MALVECSRCRAESEHQPEQKRCESKTHFDRCSERPLFAPFLSQSARPASDCTATTTATPSCAARITAAEMMFSTSLASSGAVTSTPSVFARAAIGCSIAQNPESRTTITARRMRAYTFKALISPIRICAATIHNIELTNVKTSPGELLTLCEALE